MTFSRRQWFGLAGCACLVHTEAFAQGSAEAVPTGYTSPAHSPEAGRAPRMQVRIVSGQAGQPRTWALIFGKGDEVMSGLTEWARREGIEGAHLTAIGAFSSARFGWFDKDRRAYRDISIDQQVECISLIGDVGLVGDKPAVHVHGCVGLSNGLVKGGHLIDAVTWPTLEVFVSETAVPLHKHKDDETNLELFALSS